MEYIGLYLSWHMYGEYIVFLAIFVFTSLRAALVLFTLGVVHRWNEYGDEDWYTSTSQSLFLEWIFHIFVLIGSALIIALLLTTSSVEQNAIACEVCVMLAIFGAYVIGNSTSPRAISRIVVREGGTLFRINDFGISRGAARTNIDIHWKSRNLGWFLWNSLLFAQRLSLVSLGVVSIVVFVSSGPLG